MGRRVSVHSLCLSLSLARTRLTMASTIVTAYEQLLLDNVQTVQTVESAIRNVTWFLPGRFADGDIASEGRE